MVCSFQYSMLISVLNEIKFPSYTGVVYIRAFKAANVTLQMPPCVSFIYCFMMYTRQNTQIIPAMLVVCFTFSLPNASFPCYALLTATVAYLTLFLESLFMCCIIIWRCMLIAVELIWLGCERKIDIAHGQSVLSE